MPFKNSAYEERCSRKCFIQIYVSSYEFIMKLLLISCHLDCFGCFPTVIIFRLPVRSRWSFVYR